MTYGLLCNAKWRLSSGRVTVGRRQTPPPAETPGQIQALRLSAAYPTLQCKVNVFIVTACVEGLMCAKRSVAPLNVAGPSLAIFLAIQFFEQTVRPTVESGKNVTTDRAMYLQAQRPFA